MRHVSFWLWALAGALLGLGSLFSALFSLPFLLHGPGHRHCRYTMFALAER